MQNLKDHFNTNARRNWIKAQRQRDLDLFILWLWFLFLSEQQRHLQNEIERIRYEPLKPR